MRDAKLEAFDRLCRTEYAGVVRTAYLITGDREEAVDLAQEAFARAYERWKSVSKLERPAAWLQRVVGNLALSWQRKQRVRSRIPLPVAEMGPERGRTADATPPWRYAFAVFDREVVS